MTSVSILLFLPSEDRCSFFGDYGFLVDRYDPLFDAWVHTQSLEVLSFACRQLLSFAADSYFSNQPGAGSLLSLRSLVLLAT